jgi:hypothetical protein
VSSWFLVMSDKSCNLFDTCEAAEAPLCPIQESTIKCGIWYPDEPICQASQFQELPWIKRQHQIAAFKIKSRAGFFTVSMLDALRVITAEIKGADPDYPNAEDKWFKERAATVKEKGKETKSVKKINAQKPISIPLFKDTDFLPRGPSTKNNDTKKIIERAPAIGKKKNKKTLKDTKKPQIRKK